MLNTDSLQEKYNNRLKEKNKKVNRSKKSLYKFYELRIKKGVCIKGINSLSGVI
jgi:hypothetical protein